MLIIFVAIHLVENGCLPECSDWELNCCVGHNDVTPNAFSRKKPYAIKVCLFSEEQFILEHNVEFIHIQNKIEKLVEVLRQ